MEIVLEDRRRRAPRRTGPNPTVSVDLLASFGITVKDTKEGATWTLE
jgi:hypothetical protein